MNNSTQKNYDRFFVLPVSHDVGQNMMRDMIMEIKSNYNPFTNNCGQAVENVLEKNNNISVPSNLSPNFSFDYIRLSAPGYYFER